MRARLCFVVGFCLLAGIQTVAQTGVFVEPPQYPLGSYSPAVALGDFNGDSKPDLAVASSNGTVGILLGNGDGTFRAEIDYAVNQNPSSLAVGDFNGDGKLDLAVTNSGSDTISVLFGNGDGTFQAKVDYATALGPSSVAVGDFNGDGKLDLVVANNQDNSVSIFLNSGTGTFPGRRDFATGFTPTSVAVGDFNGDQKLDVAVADCGNNGDCYNTNGVVSVLLGNGDGTLQAAVNYAAGVGPVQVVAEDLNGDGILDLATANQPGPAQDLHGSASVLLGNGDGTFQLQQQYAAGLSPSSIVVADFNGDGQMDFGVISAAQEVVGIYLNQGGGVFSLPTLLYGAGGATAAVTADFNQDHNADIAVTGGSTLFGTNFVSVLLGNGEGAFPSTPVNYPTGDNPSSAAIADLNHDGKNDVVVANEYDADIGVYLGNGDGTLQTPVTYATGGDPSWVTVADLNGDGSPDIVTANGSLSVLLNYGNGTFQTHVDYATIGEASFVAIGDVNGDGKPDLIATCPSSNAISILLGNGNGTFQLHTDFGVGGPTSVALGDFNGDGKLDLAVSNIGSNGQSPAVTVLLGNADGTFSESSFPLMVSGAIAAADLNGDGKIDLVVTGPGDTAVLLGIGDGRFQAPTYATQTYAKTLVLGDFNNDGNLDIALGELYDVGLLLGNGDGTFRRAMRYATAGGGAVAAGDLNGDGSLDVAVANNDVSPFSSSLLTILLNTGQKASSFKLAASPASQTVNAGDPTTFTVTATTANGFTGTVAIRCPLPFAGTCTANPASIVPTSSGASSTVTVTPSVFTVVGNYKLTMIGTSGSEQFGVHPTLTVKPAQPSFSVSVPTSTTPSSVTAGQSATATVTAVSSGGFTGTVTFSCKVTPSPSLPPTCSLSPAQATLTSGGQATSTLTVTTTSATAVLIRPNIDHSFGPIYAMVFPIFGVALVGMGFSSGGRKRKKLLGVAIGSVLFAALVLQVACGGNSGGGGGTSTPGTPAGNYTVTVTGSSGSTQHTTAVTLTVR
jgi:hypothetical protein